MKFKISHSLNVVVHNRRVTFQLNRHSTSITLSHYQFDNLHDVISSHGPLSPYIPLGNGMWLICKNSYRLHSPYKFITMNSRSWTKYKYKIHPKIRSFLHHDDSYKDDKCNVRNGLRSFRRSRNYPSRHTKKHLSSRTSTNGRYSLDKTQEYPNLSMRKTSDNGKPFSFRKAMDVLQSATETEANIH